MSRLELRWNDQKMLFDDRWMFDDDDDIRVAAIKFKKSNVHVHWHSEIEVIMVTYGNIVVGLNSEVYNLTVGDCVIIPSNNVHYIINDNFGKASILIFDSIIFNDDSEALCAYTLPVVTNDIEINRFQELFEIIYSEINNAEEGYRLFVRSNLYLLSGIINRFLRNRLTQKYIKSYPFQITKSQKLFEYVEDNYMNRISLVEVANSMHFNNTYFSRYFKNLTGVNFVKFVNSMRVQEAKNLLSSTDTKMVEIASMCGFGNIRTFTREFKKLTGMTASQYRQQNHNR